jgi:hypothetical protein
LYDPTCFKIDLTFLSQDIENLQKHAELFLIERRGAYRHFIPIGWLEKWPFSGFGSGIWVCFVFKLSRTMSKKKTDQTFGPAAK